MPTYEYACRTCGEHLEVVQSFKDDALTDCPACGEADALRKVFSAAGIIFKGSGWHVKDYSSAKNSGSTPSDGSSSADSSSGTGTKESSTTSSKDGGTSSGKGGGKGTGSSSTSTEAKSA